MRFVRNVSGHRSAGKSLNVSLPAGRFFDSSAGHLPPPFRDGLSQVKHNVPDLFRHL
jgi:hypothetical protein